MNITKDVVLDIDSELFLETCTKHKIDECSCPYKLHTTPVRAYFSKSGFIRHETLNHIKQRKGEAEMAQVDWLSDIKENLKENETVVSIVTSADVDSLIIHLFALSIHWTRRSDGSFRNKVYVYLQKQKSELYCITTILEILEARFGRQNVLTLVIALCIGGNDFLPKFQGISHEKWISAIFETPEALEKLVEFNNDPGSMQPISASINEEVYFEIVKRLYATASIKSEQLSFEATRQMSIKPPGKQQKHPKFWMPPKSALVKVTKLINCQIKYLFTVWTHDAVLPNFLAEGCLKKDTAGSIQYDFGDEIQIKNIETTFTIQDDELKRLIDAASISRKREKKTKRVRSIESTPVKPEQIKKKPIMSTPIKMKLQKKDA